VKKAGGAFVKSAQQTVTGKVRLKLYKGNCTPAGVSSPYSLYHQELATFGQEEIYRQADATGFINLFGLPLKVQALLRQKGEKKAF
jgi:argininosuccinate synthase